MQGQKTAQEHADPTSTCLLYTSSFSSDTKGNLIVYSSTPNLTNPVVHRAYEDYGYPVLFEKGVRSPDEALSLNGAVSELFTATRQASGKFTTMKLEDKPLHNVRGVSALSLSPNGRYLVFNLSLIHISPLPTQNQTSLEAQVSDAAHDREVALAQVAQRDRQIADLRKQLERQSVELTQVKAGQDRLATDLHNKDAGAQDLAQQQAELKQKFDAAQANAQTLQQKLDVLAKHSSEDQARAGQLTVQVKDLTQALHDRDAALDQKDELLAKDRDIRELMGARDLYVAEVYDVARTGETQKPYGRVFYTKGKSLIFYAYDLDQEPDFKTARAFQAWGQRGPDRTQALSLGIFYVDNSSKKRWVLKLDDPKMLAQIDAVFVTVEPSGGSRKPSGKPLLFAYLKADPNHP